MNPIQDRRIAIIGGGPGGLTLARLLQQGGADVKVYERDLHKGVRVQGATLDLHEESGLAALAAAGLMESFKAHYRPGADLMRITDQYGEILLDEHSNYEHEESRPEIDRGPLRKLLLESLEEGTVVWDRHFQSMVAEGAGWRLRFQDDREAYADLVIAADGANSRVRSTVTPITPYYVGVSTVEGSVYDAATNAPRMHQFLKGGKIFAMAGEKTLVLSSKGDGSLQFYMGLKTDSSWIRDSGIDFSDKASVHAWFREAYHDWGPIWDELFEHATPPFIPRATLCMPLDQDWPSQSNITLLGDAAHLMPQFAGEGVNMAMLDALELSLQLLREGSSDLHAAIAAYERQMRARAAEYGLDSVKQTDILHSPDAQRYMLHLFGR